jgi:hypothetical protein
MSTLRAIATNTKLLCDLRVQIVAWKNLRIEQRYLLNSHDLTEYFAYRNDDTGFEKRDHDIRISIGRGDLFMVSSKSGRIITSCAEASMYLVEYPGFLIRNRVETIRMPSYNDIDTKGRMVDTGDHRCLIQTLTYGEMVQRCNNRHQTVPDGGQPQDPDTLIDRHIIEESEKSADSEQVDESASNKRSRLH